MPPTTTHVVRFQARSDHSQAVFLERARFNPALLYVIFCVHHIQKLQPLIGANRAIDYQQRLMRFANRQTNSHKHARRKQSNPVVWLRILDDAAHGDAARSRVHTIVHEVDRALVRKIIFAFEADEDRDSALFVASNGSIVDRLAHTDQRGFIDIEVDVHRIDGNDCRELRLILIHQIAEREVVATDLTVDRRLYAAETQVEFEDFETGLRRLNRRNRFLLGSLITIDILR